MNKIRFLKIYPSDANFLLVKVTKKLGLAERLLEKGIIVRDVTGLMGLEGEHVRITVGTREENDFLIETLKSLEFT